MKFSVTKSAVLVCKFHVPLRRLFISGLAILKTKCVKDLGLQ